MELKQSKTPLIFVESLLSEFGARGGVFVEFSIYKSGGQGVTLSRSIFKEPLNGNINSSIDNIIANLSHGEELAFHSVIYIEKQKFYLPFIDFATSDAKAIEKTLTPRIFNYLQSPLFVFGSGRSYHGYSSRLFNFEQWVKFLGFLLLLNQRKPAEEYIDSRWIGHALEQDFGGLRITKNSEDYLKVPELIFLKRK